MANVLVLRTELPLNMDEKLTALPRLNYWIKGKKKGKREGGENPSVHIHAPSSTVHEDYQTSD